MIRAMSRVTVALTLLSTALIVVMVGGPAALASNAPFVDPSAVGYIGFCDLAGNNVTSGSVTSTPFAWKAVASVPPPKAYRGTGQNAALTVFQARQATPPSLWSGDQLTGATYYKDLPTALATYKDLSLETILKEFPPLWHGLYEIRMPVAREGTGTYTTTYAATTIQVTGSTWHVVQGGVVNCKAAKAISEETAISKVPVLPKTVPKHETLTAPTAAPSNRASKAPPTTTTTPSAGQSTAAVSQGSDLISGPLDGVAKSKGISAVLIVVIVLAALLAVGLAGLAGWRLRGGRS